MTYIVKWQPWRGSDLLEYWPSNLPTDYPKCVNGDSREVGKSTCAVFDVPYLAEQNPGCSTYRICVQALVGYYGKGDTADWMAKTCSAEFVLE